MFWKVTNINVRDICAWSVWVALCSFVPSSQWVTSGDGKQLRSQAGSCFPTVKKIAERARCSERSVRSALRTLEAAGYIRTSPTFAASDGGQRSNRFTLYPQGNAPLYLSDVAPEQRPLNVVTLPLPLPESEEA